MLGIIAKDNQHNVTLYVLRDAKPKDFEITNGMQLSKSDFAVIEMGYGIIPCLCGYDTTWHWNQHLLDTLIRRTK